MCVLVKHARSFVNIPSTLHLLITLYWKKASIKYENWFHAIVAQHVNPMHAVFDVPGLMSMGEASQSVYGTIANMIINCSYNSMI
jgi:hypothetical protein